MNTFTPSADQRAYLAKVERTRRRYEDTYGAPPSDEAFSPSVCTHIDTCEQIGCECTSARAWMCRGALDERDGRCPCECHVDERKTKKETRQEKDC